MQAIKKTLLLSILGTGVLVTAGYADYVPDPCTIRFERPWVSVYEGETSARFKVLRLDGSAGAVQVSYATSNETAHYGYDYSQTSGTLNWGANDATPRYINVPITADSVTENEETFIVTLSNPTGGAVLGSPYVSQGKIVVVPEEGFPRIVRTEVIANGAVLAAAGRTYGAPWVTTASGVGDLNGDGYEDIAFGQPGYSSSMGRVWIEFGSDRSSLPWDLSGCIVTGPNSAGNFFGRVVAGVPDFNGDGLSDLVVLSRPSGGIASVFFGNDSARLNGTVSTGLDGTNGFRISNVTLEDSFPGFAGDWNLDGKSDLGVYPLLLYGNATTSSVIDASTFTDGSQGENLSNGFAQFLTGVGDFDGDGHADHLAKVDDGLFVVYGGTDGDDTQQAFAAAHGTGSMPSSKPLARIVTIEGREWRFAAAGDVNGDGLNDIMYDPDFETDGGIWLVYGTQDRDDTVFGGSGSPVSGAGSSRVRLDNVGGTPPQTVRFSGVGDIDGDGYCEVYIRSFEPGTGIPLGYLVSGAYLAATYSSEQTVDLADISGTDGRGCIIDGDYVDDPYAGHTDTASCAGDVDRDGYRDFLLADGDDTVILVFGDSFQGPSGPLDPASASYTVHQKAGNVPPTPVGAIGNGTHSVPFSRMTIDYDAGVEDSWTTVQVHYNQPPGLANVSLGADVSQVYWEFETKHCDAAPSRVGNTFTWKTTSQATIDLHFPENWLPQLSPLQSFLNLELVYSKYVPASSSWTAWTACEEATANGSPLVLSGTIVLESEMGPYVSAPPVSNFPPKRMRLAVRHRTFNNPVISVADTTQDFGDPAIIRYNHIYYWYRAGNPLSRFTSSDLVTWTGPTNLTISGTPYGNWGYWAPDAFEYNGEFFIVYSVAQTGSTDCCYEQPQSGCTPDIDCFSFWARNLRTAIVRASSPDALSWQQVNGPLFNPLADACMADGNSHVGTIDGHAFVDVDGRVYLYFTIERGTSDVRSEIWGCEISYNGSTWSIVDGPRRVSGGPNDSYYEPWELTNSSEDWMFRATNEGPWMFRSGSIYTLLYSGNRFFRTQYAVGGASALQPLPDEVTGCQSTEAENLYLKYSAFSSPPEPAPILGQSSTQFVGTGHNCLAWSPAGDELWTAYHKHDDQYPPGVLSPHREVMISPVKYTAGAFEQVIPTAVTAYPNGKLPKNVPFGPNLLSLDKLRYWVVGQEDREYWRRDGSSLVIEAQPGETKEDLNDYNNLFLLPIDRGLLHGSPDPVECTLEFDFVPSAQAPGRMGLYVWENEDNYIRYTLGWDDEATMFLGVERQGFYSETLNTLASLDLETPRLFIKARFGTESGKVEFWLSDDGAAWQDIGSVTIPQNFNNPHVGFGAVLPTGTGDVDARVHSFTIDDAL